MRKTIKIFPTTEELWPFLLTDYRTSRNRNLGQRKVTFGNSLARSCQYYVVKYPVWLKTYGDFHFTFFGLGSALVNENGYLSRPLARSYLCLSIIKKISKYPKQFTRYAHADGLTDSQVDYRVHSDSRLYSRSVDFSEGRELIKGAQQNFL